MAANAQNDVDDSQPKNLCPKDYVVDIRLTADPATYDASKNWILVMEVRCHDLLQIMRHGLFWTTSNVVPESGFYAPTSASIKSHPFQRSWVLREFADKPESQSRWSATAILYVHSIKTLANFRLHTLYQRNVVTSAAWNPEKKNVFSYSTIDDENNYNCFVDSLHPLHGSWWFWPMEAVLDYDTLGCGAETEKESLVKLH